MCAMSVGGGFGDEDPVFELAGLVDAVRAVFGDWLFGDGIGLAFHGNGGQAYFGIRHRDFELAGKESTG